MWRTRLSVERSSSMNLSARAPLRVEYQICASKISASAAGRTIRRVIPVASGDRPPPLPRVAPGPGWPDSQRVAREEPDGANRERAPATHSPRSDPKAPGRIRSCPRRTSRRILAAAGERLDPLGRSYHVPHRPSIGSSRSAAGPAPSRPRRTAIGPARPTRPAAPATRTGALSDSCVLHRGAAHGVVGGGESHEQVRQLALDLWRTSHMSPFVVPRRQLEVPELVVPRVEVSDVSDRCLRIAVALKHEQPDVWGEIGRAHV